MVEALATMATSLGLGLGAGVNAYATFLVFGVLERFYPNLFPGELASFFASTPVLIGMGVMYTFEFFADKIPAVDHVWDAIHTFIRPVAGAAVALAAATDVVPQPVAVVASILAGGAALSSHAAKSTIRVASTTTTGGVANPVISLVEDVWVVFQTVTAVFLPFVFLALAILVLIPAFFLFRRRFRRKEAYS